MGTNADNKFSFTDGFLKNVATSRWVGVYNSQDWRCYPGNDPSTINNIKNTVTAFYKKISGSGGDDPDAPTVSVSISDYAVSNSWENGKQYTSVIINDKITASASGGANDGKYYTTGNEWRFYESSNGKLTISAANGTTIKSINIKYNSSNNGVFKVGNVIVPSDEDYNVNAASIVLSASRSSGSNNGQAKVTEITVTYN